MLKGLIALTLLALLTPAGVCHSQTAYVADLFGRDVVPPTPSWGEAHFQLLNDCGAADADSSVLLFNLWQIGVSGIREAYLAHGKVGENGPVLVPLASGQFWLVAGSLVLSPDICAFLQEGELYVVIQTERYPAGEVRGQLLRAPTPTLDSSWGRVKSVFRTRGMP